MKKQLLIWVFVFAGFIACISCNISSTYNNRVEDKDDALKVANAFYDLVKNQDYNNTYSLYSKKFLEVSDMSKMENILQSLTEKLGAIENIQLDHWETQVITGTNPSSNYALYFVVSRRKYPSKETFSLTKENGEIKINGYNVISDGLIAPDLK